MDKSDILDKIKNDISQSGQDITNSIDAFNNNLNRINNYINPNEINSKVQNKEQILKTSSDMEIFKLIIYTSIYIKLFAKLYLFYTYILYLY